MKQSNKICRYLDIPIQHVSDKILTKMKRGHSKDETVALIKKFRSEIPDIALRTTLLVGFPGETDKDFQELEEFVKEAEIDRLGVFQYSPEEGTFSEKNYRDNVSKKKKQERADRIMQIQQKISLNLNVKKIGKVFEVLIDRQEGEYFIGRTQYDSPEVDCEVLIKISDAPNIKIGNFYSVQITDAEEFDLYGKPNE
jgi:ribosomal protein S12 methylthiotransferase